MILLATPNNISEILELINGDVILVPIVNDNTCHYTECKIICLYVYVINSEKEIIIGFSHNDLDNIDIRKFFDGFNVDRIISFNSNVLKEYLVGTCVDANVLTWYYSNEPIRISQIMNRIFRFYERKYPNVPDINEVIPIMKILEYCRNIKNIVLENYRDGYCDEFGFVFYNEAVRNIFDRLNDIPIGINRELVQSKYNKLLSNDYIKSNYNFLTATARPSNSTSGINLVGLNKHDGSRRIIKSKFEGGKLFEFDYDSYHIRLISKIINYKLPDGNIHEFFAKEYFGNVDLTEDVYNRSKKITFAKLYGESNEKETIDFFRHVNTYKDILWNSYIKDGYFKAVLSGRKFMSTWFTDMTKSKLFSYIIQSYETEVNMMMLTEILQYLYSHNSDIVLYSYDAILIDYHPEDGYEVLRKIKELMAIFNIKIHTKAGVTYGDMVEVIMK